MLDSNRAFISFFGFEPIGNAFETLSLSLATTDFSQSWSFNTVSEAETFFSDHPISLGNLSGTSDRLTMQLDWTSSTANHGFSANYAFSATAVPEPSAIILLTAGTITGFGLRCRKRLTAKSQSGHVAT